MSIFPSASHHLPKKGFDLPKRSIEVDLRRDLTAWKALVWAYADQLAYWGSGGGPQCFLGPGIAAICYGEEGQYEVPPSTDVDDDAMAIDTLVRNWFDIDLKWRDGLARYAMARKPPPPVEALEPLHVLSPARDPDYVPRLIYPPSGQRHAAYICVIEFGGHSAAAIQRHREFMALFHELLNVMRGLTLKKWRITAPGC